MSFRRHWTLFQFAWGGYVAFTFGAWTLEILFIWKTISGENQTMAIILCSIYISICTVVLFLIIASGAISKIHVSEKGISHKIFFKWYLWQWEDMIGWRGLKMDREGPVIMVVTKSETKKKLIFIANQKARNCIETCNPVIYQTILKNRLDKDDN